MLCDHISRYSMREATSYLATLPGTAKQRRIMRAVKLRRLSRAGAAYLCTGGEYKLRRGEENVLVPNALHAAACRAGPRESAMAVLIAHPSPNRATWTVGSILETAASPGLSR